MRAPGRCGRLGAVGAVVVAVLVGVPSSGGPGGTPEVLAGVTLGPTGAPPATPTVQAGTVPPVAVQGGTVQPNSVRAWGAAPLGDLAGQQLQQPVVGMASTADGGGYWLVAADGGVFAYGDAAFRGSEGGARLDRPIVGMAADPATGGYWMVAADGGVFSFGAPFFGSAGGEELDQPVVGMASTADGGGYWLVAADGGVFAYGDAAFEGTTLSDPLAPAIAVAASGSGYRVAYGQRSPFGPVVSDYLAQRTGRVTAALYDADSASTSQLDPGDLQVTASIVKVDIMATALLEAQQAGLPLPPAEADLMAPMIEASDNDAATALWDDVGGPAAVARTDTALGLTSTTPSPVSLIPGTSLPGWGTTTTTAMDQVTLLRAFAFPNPVLSDPSRSYGLSLMGAVEADQDWGVTGGVPPGVSVALKNGWLPLGPDDWQVNSVGAVTGAGRSYVLAVMVTGSPTEAYGISTIDTLSSMVFSQLG